MMWLTFWISSPMACSKREFEDQGRSGLRGSLEMIRVLETPQQPAFR